jgi:hypothetical protein
LEEDKRLVKTLTEEALQSVAMVDVDVNHIQNLAKIELEALNMNRRYSSRHGKLQLAVAKFEEEKSEERGEYNNIAERKYSVPVRRTEA